MMEVVSLPPGLSCPKQATRIRGDFSNSPLYSVGDIKEQFLSTSAVLAYCFTVSLLALMPPPKM
jgi:hypothetical protein